MYKRIDFTNLEGLATYQDTLEFLQTSYRDTISTLARLVGSRVIVTGVVDQGLTYSDGWVVIDGELMPFTGGLNSDRVIVDEPSNSEVFGNGTIQNVYYTKSARLGVSGGYAFSDFIRVDTVANISEGLKNMVVAYNNLSYAFNTHVHTWDQIVGKPTTFAPSYHTHPWDQVTGKPSVPSFYFGSFTLNPGPGEGDSPQDGRWTLYIPDQGTLNYRVTGTLVSYGNNWGDDNDVMWMIRNKQSNSFELLTREVSGNRQYLWFDYVVIKL
jgi:hypothetical protein